MIWNHCSFHHWRLYVVSIVNGGELAVYHRRNTEEICSECCLKIGIRMQSCEIQKYYRLNTSRSSRAADLIFQDTKVLKENAVLEFSLLFGIAVTSVEKIH